MDNKKVIFQVLMGLDIGGAETHVVETSLELKKRGYRVIVISNGGVYENYLNENGIETVMAPLNNRSITNMIKSYFILRKKLKIEKPVIVHSHARIPSFIISLINFSKKINFITTTHGTYKVNGILKVLTDWGKEVFAVSEDIKSYLKENYNIEEDKIHLNINGVNLEKYKKKTEGTSDYILHVSRLDADTSKMAYMLIEVAKGNSDLEIVVVGDGTELEKLKKLSKNLENIKFEGRKSNVNDYLDKAKIFIGISRAVLEAMCYNMPIILGGEYGYVGILKQDSLKKEEYNNFTCRGEAPLDKSTIEKDIREILSKNNEWNWCRRYIEDNYSVKKMVDIYENIYKKYEGF